jgi:hypothetical protein
VNRAAIILSLFAAFVIGTACGLSGAMVIHHWDLGMHPAAQQRRHHPTPKEAMSRLQKLLDLTPDQMKRIEPSVVESQRQFAAARETLHTRIDAELTPEQRERWKRFQREHPFSSTPPRDDRDTTGQAKPGS